MAANITDGPKLGTGFAQAATGTSAKSELLAGKTSHDAPVTTALETAPDVQLPAKQLGGRERSRRRFERINSNSGPELRGAKALVEARAYARQLGFSGLQRDASGNTLLVTGAGATKRLDVSKNPSLLELGQAINALAFGGVRLLPFRPPEPTATAMSWANAQLGGFLSQLAYWDESAVRTQLARLGGFDLSTFRWLEDAGTDTQGFVVSDVRGNTFVVFRGSESATDFYQDAKAAKVTPGWAQQASEALRGSAEPLRVHSGFEQCLEAVWGQMESALAAQPSSRSGQGGLFFFGHSLGASVAQLASVRYALTHGTVASASPATVSPSPLGPGITVVARDASSSAEGVGSTAPKRPLQLYTVGSPRVGNNPFKRTLETLVPAAHRMVNVDGPQVNDQDLVTRVPGGRDYWHGGSAVLLFDGEKGHRELSLAELAQTRFVPPADLSMESASFGLELTTERTEQADAEAVAALARAMARNPQDFSEKRSELGSGGGAASGEAVPRGLLESFTLHKSLRYDALIARESLADWARQQPQNR